MERRGSGDYNGTLSQADMQIDHVARRAWHRQKEGRDPKLAGKLGMSKDTIFTWHKDDGRVSEIVTSHSLFDYEPGFSKLQSGELVVSKFRRFSVVIFLERLLNLRR